MDRPFGALPPDGMAWQLGRTARQIDAINEFLDTLATFKDAADRLRSWGNPGEVFRQTDDGSLWMYLGPVGGNLPLAEQWVRVVLPSLEGP